MAKRTLTLLTFEGWIYVILLLFLLVGALARQINLLVVMYGVMGGPLVLSWGLSRKSLRGLKVERHMPHRVAAGDIVQVGLEITNPRPRLGAWTLLSQDRLQRPGSPPLRVTVMHSYIRAGDKRQASYKARLTSRGRYRLGPVRITTRFPFGLLRSSSTYDLDEELLVTPRMGQLTGVWRRRLATIQSGAGTGKRRRGTLEGDFYGLREWRTDDSQRWIHWRTSARRQTLVVRQFEQPQRQDIAMVLDLWQPAKPSAEQQDNVELAVSFAASTVTELARDGAAHVTLDVLAANPSTLVGTASAPLVDEVLEVLACAEATPEDKLDAALATLLDKLPTSTLVILVSTRAAQLNDRSRFPNIWQTPQRSGWLDRIVTIDVSSEKLADYFSVEREEKSR